MPPAPVELKSIPEPTEQVTTPKVEANEPPAPPPVINTSVPVPLHPMSAAPDSSVTPVVRDRDPEEIKPLVKSEPRNGLEKVDTSHYIDPIERSLASLERSLKADVPMDVSVGVSESSMRLEDDFPLHKPQLVTDAAHQNLMAQLGGLTEVARVPDQIKTDLYLPSHNGFVEKNVQHEREILRTDSNPNLSGITSVPPVSSIFDPISSVPLPVISQSHHSVSNAPSLITPAVKKEEMKPLLTPKPIEDLMGVSNAMTNNMSDRSKYEMEKKMEESKNLNFAQAFKVKQEQNLKNASSWSSLAQAGSPQSIPNVTTNNQVKQKPMDSFQVSRFFILLLTNLNYILLTF